jgi:hypothetical protein
MICKRSGIIGDKGDNGFSINGIGRQLWSIQKQNNKIKLDSFLVWVSVKSISGTSIWMQVTYLKDVLEEIEIGKE